MLIEEKTQFSELKSRTSSREIIEEGKNNILTLKKLLDQKHDPIIIRGKRYIEYSEWITLGNFYGLSVRTHDAVPVEVRSAKGFKAKADIIRISDGVVVSGAEAYCLNNERNWKNKEDFQLASMAQTRAGSKAFSNALRWIVELDSTLAGTPADEMRGFRINNNNVSKKRKKAVEVDSLEITNKLSSVKNELKEEKKIQNQGNIKAKIIQEHSKGIINTSMKNALFERLSNDELVKNFK